MQYRPIISYNDFILAVQQRYELMAGEWRVGQTYFNLLRSVAPRIADEIKSGPHDPFHSDSISTSTHLHVSQMWGEHVVDSSQRASISE